MEFIKSETMKKSKNRIKENLSRLHFVLIHIFHLLSYAYLFQRMKNK